MPRAVVTGGGGFIGSHLCERLLVDGYDVICLDNHSTSDAANVANLCGPAAFEARTCDVTERFDVAGGVDVVVHLASPASPVDYGRLPIETLRAGSEGTFNCLRLAEEKRARFVLASTSEVYGDPLVHPQSESYWGNVNSVGPRSMYDEAKRFAEALAIAYHRRSEANVGIARIFNCYGPRMRPDDGRAIATFIDQALRGQPLTVTGDGSQTRSFCYIDDLVDGLVRLIRCDATGPINLGNTDEVTVLDLAQRVRAATDTDSPITFVPRPPEDPELRCPDIALARRVLGWEPAIGLEEGLKQTIAWFRSVVADGRIREQQ
jgi:dTDP-glucose 4,6-dehydratase